MKKITFKLFAVLTLLVATITNGQSASYISINGEDPTTFLNENTPLAGGTVLSLVVEYTNITADLTFRILDDWSFIPSTVQTLTTTLNDSNPLQVTFDVTIPEVKPAIAIARLQLLNGGLASPKYGPVTFGIAESAVETNAAVSMTSIEGVAPATYLANNSDLTEGDVLTIGIDYTAIKPNPTKADATEVGVRFLDKDYIEIPEGTAIYQPVTNSDSSQSTTIDITVPNISENLTGVIIQVLGYGNIGGTDGGVYAYSNGYSIDASTLSFNKTSLEGVTVDGSTISFGAQHVNDAYTIYNITGQSVQSGSVSSEVSIDELATGVYILSTDKGSLKFAK